MLGHHADASTDSIQLPRLLVSVRNAEEAQLAVDEGVRLIDVKEPRRGSLGAAAAESVREVADICDSKFLWSVALGELLDTPPAAFPADLRPTFVKCGLSGCGPRTNWQELWQRRMAHYGGAAVAVVYADWEAAGAPSARDVVDHAAAAHCPAVLLDTFDKTKGSLLQQMTREQIARWISSVHQGDMLAVVAGSLTREMVGPLLREGADCVAVRGAACRGSRSGPLDRTALRKLVSTVNSTEVSRHAAVKG